MENENKFNQLSEVINQRAGMTNNERRIFDEECARYDLEVDKAKSELLKMINILPAPGVERDPETRAAIYWGILKSELSPGSISRVCRRAMAGNIGKEKWLPVPGELIRFAKENWIQVGPVYADPRNPVPAALAPPEHLRLEGRFYSGTQFRSDETARIGRNFRALANRLESEARELRDGDRALMGSKYAPVVSRKELAEMDEGEREKHKIEAESYLEKLRALPPPKLSEELRKKLGCASGDSGQKVKS